MFKYSLWRTWLFLVNFYSENELFGIDFMVALRLVIDNCASTLTSRISFVESFNFMYTVNFRSHVGLKLAENRMPGLGKSAELKQR